MTEEGIVNKVASSGLINIDLEDFYPKGSRLALDIAPWLYEGIILKEKDFRDHVKNHEWSQYENAYVSIFCSEDAIIPQWAYMLIAASLEPYAKRAMVGTSENLEMLLMEEALDQIDYAAYQDKRVIVKGCGDLAIASQAYLSFTARLRPHAKSIMFGEACSTVPIYKQKK
jgi:S-adenosylmethionine/arginine decarboxylase-like enzyme